MGGFDQYANWLKLDMFVIKSAFNYHGFYFSVLARRCPSSCSSAIFGGARNGAASKEGLCSDVQDFPHWNKKPVQILPWRTQETQLRDTNFVFGTHINFQEPSQHETSVSTTVIKCFLWFRFLVRLRAEFWFAFREVSIVLFGLLGIFCDLWLVKKISRHFLNQSDLMRKTTMTFSRAFPPLNASFTFSLGIVICSFEWLLA